jgi:DNA-binding beta-propeller fold protein YncE
MLQNLTKPRLLLLLSILLILVGVGLHTFNEDASRTSSEGSDKHNRHPFDLAVPPTLKPDEGLVKELQIRETHEIGFIPNDYNNAIYIVDLSTEEYLGKLYFDAPEPRGGPDSLAFTPDGNHLIVTRGKFSNDILIIRTDTLELVKQIPGGRYNGYIYVNPERNEAYILSSHYQDTNLNVLNINSFEITQKLSLESELQYAALSSDSTSLYVTTEDDVVFMDTSTMSIIKQVPVNTTYWKRVIAHPSEPIIYVVNNPDVEEKKPLINVYNTTTESNIANIKNLCVNKTWDGAITALAITPSGDRLFSVSQMNELVVVDTTTYERIQEFSVKQPDYYGKPDWIKFNGEESKAYFIYWGGLAIDTPHPDKPSVIGVMDIETYEFTNIIEMDEHAGAGQMIIMR